VLSAPVIGAGVINSISIPLTLIFLFSDIIGLATLPTISISAIVTESAFVPDDIESVLPVVKLFAVVAVLSACILCVAL